MHTVPFKEALRFWLKLGFISFGGPAGQIAIMHEYLVEKKKWISEKRFLHALNYCMLLPGPEAQQLATYTGWLMHGTKGGLAAGLLFILPSVFILLGLSALYVTFGKIAWVGAVFSGLKPAVVTIVIGALYKIARKSLKGPFQYTVAAASFVGIFVFKVPFPLIVAAALLAGYIAVRVGNKLPDTETAITQQAEESNYAINQQSIIPWVGFSPTRFIYQCAITLLLWALPFVGFYWFTSNFAFWKDLSLFFTKAALLTFGGAYAVLPYVAQVAVEQLNWLNQYQMLDGLALGETTPGPLIMVLAFVGFMAGYNLTSSLAIAAGSLLVTVYYTFLPCFFFIFAGAPLIEKTHSNSAIKKILEPVTAAVAGVILSLALYLGQAVVFPFGLSLSNINLPAVLWVAVSLLALFRFQVNMVLLILVSGFYGLIAYLLGYGI